MTKINVFDTEDEANQQLKQYLDHNTEAFKEYEEHEGDLSDILKKQTYYFVAELASFVDDGPGKYYYDSVAFPFFGHTDLYDDIPSLVQGIQHTINHQTPRNIEAILYTVENHDERNQECKKEAEESRKFAENLTPEETYIDKKELDEFLQEVETLESIEVRGLNLEERTEFETLYK